MWILVFLASWCSLLVFQLVAHDNGGSWKQEQMQKEEAMGVHTLRHLEPMVGKLCEASAVVDHSTMIGTLWQIAAGAHGRPMWSSILISPLHPFCLLLTCRRRRRQRPSHTCLPRRSRLQPPTPPSSLTKRFPTMRLRLRVPTKSATGYQMVRDTHFFFLTGGIDCHQNRPMM